MIFEAVKKMNETIGGWKYEENEWKCWENGWKYVKKMDENTKKIDNIKRIDENIHIENTWKVKKQIEGKLVQVYGNLKKGWTWNYGIFGQHIFWTENYFELCRRNNWRMRNLKRRYSQNF